MVTELIIGNRKKDEEVGENSPPKLENGLDELKEKVLMLRILVMRLKQFIKFVVKLVVILYVILVIIVMNK